MQCCTHSQGTLLKVYVFASHVYALSLTEPKAARLFCKAWKRGTRPRLCCHLAAVLSGRGGKLAHVTAHTQVLSDTAAACQGADLILSGPLSLTATMCVAEQLRIPWVPVVLGPVMPTAEFPSWAISSSPFRFKCLNRASYSLIFWALFKQESGRINSWRRDSLGLPPLKQGSAGVLAACPTIPVITMCTSHVIPGLRAPQDWGSNVHLTGFAFPAATPPDTVDPDLRAFLQLDDAAAAGGDATGSKGSSTAGSRGKPMYLGFGSMPAPDPKALLQLAVQVVQQTGRRAVLVAGWSNLGGLIGSGEGQVQLPEGLLVVPSAPHDFLLPG